MANKFKNGQRVKYVGKSDEYSDNGMTGEVIDNHGWDMFGGEDVLVRVRWDEPKHNWVASWAYESELEVLL